MIRQRKGSSRIHKVISDYGIADYYKNYNKIYRGTKNEVSYKTYSAVLDGILSGIANSMCNRMYDFKLPYGLGRIITRKYKPQVKYDDNGNPYIKRPIDWKLTKQLWIDYPHLEKVQFVYHTNPHSGGYVFSIIYRKRGCIFRNRLYYTAQINRSIKRNIASKIMNNEFDSLETNNK